MGLFAKLFKLAIAITFDAADFFIGRITGFGTLFDIFGGFLGLALWGPLGGTQFAEIIDFTDQVDGFIPTLTIIGLIKILGGE